MKEIIFKEKGMALITVLLLSVLMVMMTVSMVFISSNHLNMMGNIEEKVRALKAAEAMAEYALTKLNQDPVWGISRSEADNIEIPLEGSTGYIKFSGTEYLSFNNLKSQTKIERSAIGDTKLTGTIPAYAAEIICIGKTDEATKIVKVIFVRNDIFPYPINSEGKILFNAGDVRIHGSNPDPNYPPGDPNYAQPPGNIHSNWDGSGFPDTGVDSDYWSISGLSGLVYANGGIASAVGDINLPDDPAKMNKSPNLGSEGKLDFEDIDPGEILEDKKSSFPLDQREEPSSYSFTYVYFIPDDPAVMGQALAASLTEEERNNLSVPPPGNPGAYGVAAVDPNTIINVVSEDLADFTFTSVTGIERDIRKDWATQPSDLGWNSIEGTAVEATFEATISIALPEYDPVTGDLIGYQPPTYVTRQATDTVNLPPGNEVELDITGYNWPGALNTEPGEDPTAEQAKIIQAADLLGQSEYGVGKVLPGGVLDKFVPPGESEEELGLEIDIGDNKFSTNAKITLTKDIYIESSVNIDPNAYTRDATSIIGTPLNPPADVFSLRKTRIKEIDDDGEPFIKTMDLTLDLNGYNIYSEAHLLLEAEVTGTGGMVTEGKLAYFHGVKSDDIVSIAADDLHLQLGPGYPQYDINGYIYSQDDTFIYPYDPNEGIHYGGYYEITKRASYDIDVEYETGGSSVTFTDITGGPFDDYVTVMKKRIEPPEPDPVYYTYSIPKGTKLICNNKSYDLTGYELRIIDNDDTGLNGITEVKVYDSSGNLLATPPFPVTELNSIGKAIAVTFNLAEERPDVMVTGSVIGLNKHTGADNDYHGNNSFYIRGTNDSEVMFCYETTGIGRVTELRGDNFKVRLASWFEL